MSELAEASDVRTPATRLAALARRPRRDVQAAVAQNPSAPWPVLRDLVAFHTDAVLTNPALPLLELEHLLLWADLDEWNACAVASSKHVPLSFVMWCISYGRSTDLDRERWLLFQNLAVPQPQRLQVLGVFTPQESLRLGRDGLDVLVGAEWAQRLRGLGLSDLSGSAPGALSESDLRALHDLGAVTHLRLAQHPAATPELISMLMDSPEPDVVREAARHPNLPDLWCDLLVTSEDPDQREWIAHNPKLSQGLVCQLASQGPVQVNEALALHARLPERMVADWARHAPTRVRLQLVERPSLDPAVLAVLAEDRESNVRAKVAALTSLPESLVRALASDREPEVRRALSQNAATPTPLRRRLEEDPEVLAWRRRWRGRRG